MAQQCVLRVKKLRIFRIQRINDLQHVTILTNLININIIVVVSGAIFLFHANMEIKVVVAVQFRDGDAIQAVHLSGQFPYILRFHAGFYRRTRF